MDVNITVHGMYGLRYTLDMIGTTIGSVNVLH